MTENERKTMLNLADTIQGEINRMCVTKDLNELNSMALHARRNIEKLHNMRYPELQKEE
jgi:hypothetical protein